MKNPKNLPNMVIVLTTNNHPGVLSHVVGLFARRGFNLDAVLCVPDATRPTSTIYLSVRNDDRLEQIVAQIRKLYDVRDVVLRDDVDHSIFHRIGHALAS